MFALDKTQHFGQLNFVACKKLCMINQMLSGIERACLKWSRMALHDHAMTANR